MTTQCEIINFMGAFSENVSLRNTATVTRFEVIQICKYANNSFFYFVTIVFQLVRSLLAVFVAIEMTGQSVAFEQKFNYRSPMYIVMDYLWQIEEHKEAFK